MIEIEGYSSPTYYFNSEGRQNLEKTVDLVYERAIELKVAKIVVFTANGEGAFKIKERYNNKKIKVIAATFPFNKPFFFKDHDKPTIAGTSSRDVQRELKGKGIKLVQGTMALQDIPVPGSLGTDLKLNIINSTLSLLSGGLKLCIEAILMATDSGSINQGEEVIAFSADTAIVATGCRKEWLFHPQEGLEIREIICKPRKRSKINTDKK